MVIDAACEAKAPSPQNDAGDTRGRLLESCTQPGANAPAAKALDTAGLTPLSPEGGLGNVFSPIAAGAVAEVKENGVKIAAETAVGTAVGYGAMRAISALGVRTPWGLAAAGVGALGYGAYKWYTGDLSTAISGMGNFLGAVGDAYNPKGLSLNDLQSTRNTLYAGGQSAVDHAPDAFFLGAGAVGLGRMLTKGIAAETLGDAATTIATPQAVLKSAALTDATAPVARAAGPDALHLGEGTTQMDAGELLSTQASRGLSSTENARLVSLLRFPENPDLQASLETEFGRFRERNGTPFGRASDITPAQPGELAKLWAAVDEHPAPSTGFPTVDKFSPDFERWSRARANNLESYFPSQMDWATSTKMRSELQGALQTRLSAGETLSNTDKRWLELKDKGPDTLSETENRELSAYNSAVDYIPGTNAQASQMRDIVARQTLGTASNEERAELLAWTTFPDNEQFRGVAQRELTQFKQYWDVYSKPPEHQADIPAWYARVDKLDHLPVPEEQRPEILALQRAYPLLPRPDLNAMTNPLIPQWESFDKWLVRRMDPYHPYFNERQQG